MGDESNGSVRITRKTFSLRDDYSVRIHTEPPVELELNKSERKVTVKAPENIAVVGAKLDQG